MPFPTITSAQALARGALAAGVKVVTSYPGSPSSETVELLIELAGPHGLHVEWSSNEKVAMEIGIGVSIAGRRALVCTKSVGMNAMVDPLMVLNLTPVHGGLVEENEPYLEPQIKAVAHDSGSRARIAGKLTGHTPREGELFRWQIQQALERFLPGFAPAHSYLEQGEAAERPPRENHCAGCRFGVIVDALREVATALGQNPVLVADPGCLTPVADRIDAKFAIGSAVGVAEGLARAGIGERAVALFGDSSFFHTTLPAIVNAVHQGSDILMVVLDNGATVTSGFQTHPGVARDARGRPAPALDIERIARACGVQDVHTVGPDDLDAKLRPLFREGLTRPGLRLIVARSPCDHPPQ